MLGSIIGSGMESSVGSAQTITAAIMMAGLEEPERPTYEIPKEIETVLNIAKSRNQDQYMPGYESLLGELGATTSSAVSSMRETGRFDPSIYEKELKQKRGLGIDNANYRLMNEQNLTSALKLMGGYKDKEFSYNESGKYLDEKADYLAKKSNYLGYSQEGFDDIINSAYNMPDFTSMGGV